MLTLANIVWNVHMYFMDYSFEGWEAVFNQFGCAEKPISIRDAHERAKVFALTGRN